MPVCPHWLSCTSVVFFVACLPVAPLLGQAAGKAKAKAAPASARKVGGAVRVVHPAGASPLVACLVSGNGATVVRLTKDDRLAFFKVADYLGADAGKRGKNDGVYRYRMSRLLLSADGSRLVARLNRATLGVLEWTQRRPRMRHQLRGMPGVGACALHPDSTQLATSMGDGLVRAWNVETGKAVSYLPIQGTPLTAMAFTPDGKTLVTADVKKRLRLFGWPRGGALREATLPATVRQIAVAPDGKSLAFAVAREVHVQGVDGVAVQRWPCTAEVLAIAFADRAGKVLAAALKTGEVVLLDAATGKVVRRLAAHPKQRIVCLSRLPAGDRDLLVTAAAGGDIVYWDVAAPAPAKQGRKAKKRRKRRGRR